MELNHLPDELFHVLFSYFDVDTLLTTCVLVCKRWRELIHQMRFKKLCFEHPSERKDHYSIATYYTNFWDNLPVPVDPRHLIFTSKTSFFDFPFIKMFEHLKCLKLNWSLTSEFDFSKLNQFSALEELDVSITFREPTEKTLNLPKLCILNISFEAVHQSKLTIDCPVKMLFAYYYSYSENDENDENSNVPAPINFVHPDILEEVVVFGKTELSIFSACKNVRIFRDYQYLYSTIRQSEVFLADHLETFPNLEELHYHCSFSGNVLEESHLGDLMNAARSRISGALQKKRQQNRSVKIFFQGIQIEGESFLESLELKTMSDLPSLQSKHYDLLATNLYYYDICDYSSLEKRFDDSLPTDLFSKFTRLDTVIATGGVKHLNQFAAFLRQCKCLCQLEVEIDSLDQNFCDQLHVNCFFLKKLMFRDLKKEENNANGDHPVNQENNPVNQGNVPIDQVDQVNQVDAANQDGDLANAVEKKLTINDDLPFKKLNFDFLAKQINLLTFSVGEFDMETALRCLQAFPSKLFGFTFKYKKGNFSILKSKANKPYSLKATFYQSLQDGTEFSTNSNHISFDNLALELEFFMKKMDNLALDSKV